MGVKLSIQTDPHRAYSTKKNKWRQVRWEHALPTLACFFFCFLLNKVPLARLPEGMWSQHVFARGAVLRRWGPNTAAGFAFVQTARDAAFQASQNNEAQRISRPTITKRQLVRATRSS